MEDGKFGESSAQHRGWAFCDADRMSTCHHRRIRVERIEHSLASNISLKSKFLPFVVLETSSATIQSLCPSGQCHTFEQTTMGAPKLVPVQKHLLNVADRSHKSNETYGLMSRSNSHHAFS